MPRRDPEKLARARELRANMSPPERTLWHISARTGWKASSSPAQVECGPYYIDFAARQPRLAIELDGESHGGREKQDGRRTAVLEKYGWWVIRFTNDDVMGNAEGVARAILIVLGRDF